VMLAVPTRSLRNGQMVYLQPSSETEEAEFSGHFKTKIKEGVLARMGHSTQLGSEIIVRAAVLQSETLLSLKRKSAG
jgi:hypothetical protein